MKKMVLAAAVVGAFAVSGFAQMVDDFSYADGPLTAVSGGAWEKWDAPSSGDADVIGGVARINVGTDVDRFFGDIFSGSNNGVIEFDLMVTAGDTPNDYYFYFGQGSSPGNPGIPYTDGVMVIADLNPGSAPDPGKMWLGTWDLFENRAVDYGQVTVNEFHTIRLDMVRNGVTNRVDYNMSVDGSLFATDHFTTVTMTAVEFYNSASSTAALGYVDNMKVVPEPSAIAAVAVGLVGLAIRRRR